MIVQAGQVSNFNYADVNQRSSLNVAATILDNTEGLPGTLAEFVHMTYSGLGGVYLGQFTFTAGHTYSIIKLVYTDNTFETIDTDFSPDQDDVQCVDVGGGGGGDSCTLVGIVSASPTLVGCVEC